MISFDEALGLVCAAAQPTESETVPISAAARRILAAPVVARIASPRCDVSAMDGFAVRDADLADLPARLEVIGESFAGAGWAGTFGPGECVRIFTGAPVPMGADRVVMQEHVRAEDHFALFEQKAGEALHIRERGGDFDEGEHLLPAGRTLDKRAIVAAAGADVDRLEVHRRPRLFILSTGDELAEPGTALAKPDSVPDSVSLGIASLAATRGAEVVGRTRLRDDLAELEAAAAEAVACADVVVVTGGASVGERDYAKRMFEPLGLELIFSKVSIKPGKPVWLGRVGGTLVMGLPGNPSSALVTARLLLEPLLAGISGGRAEDALRWRSAPLALPLAACGGRETFHRAQWSDDRVEILGFQDSSAQRALAQAELLVRQRAHSPALSAGATVEVLDF